MNTAKIVHMVCSVLVLQVLMLSNMIPTMIFATAQTRFTYVTVLPLFPF